MMDKKKKRDECLIPERKDEKKYSVEELLKLGKEKNDMDFANKKIENDVKSES